jgi:hypothetical protein
VGSTPFALLCFSLNICLQNTAFFVDIDHKKIVRRLNPDAPEEEAMEPDNDIILIDNAQLGSLLKGLDGLFHRDF